VTRGAIKATEAAPELRKEIMAALDRIATLPYPRLGFAALGRVQPKACPPCPFLRRPIAVSPIGLCLRQAARLKARDASLSRGWVNHQGAQDVFGLTTIVGIGCGHYDS
jgi:hypothetical protein